MKAARIALALAFLEAVKRILLRAAETKTSKAELVAALKEAFAYCDRAYGALTEATAIRTVPLFGGETPKLGELGVNSLHSVEHYGNLVTYMRMKGIVPPTSEPAFQPEVKK